MRKVNNGATKDNPKNDISSNNNKDLCELTDKELEKVAGGVPGYWDYNDPTTHS